MENRGENKYIIIFVNKDIEKVFIEKLIEPLSKIHKDEKNKNDINIDVQSLECSINKVDIPFLYKSIKERKKLDEADIEIIYIHNDSENNLNLKYEINDNYKKINKLKSDERIKKIRKITFEKTIEDCIIIDKDGICKYLNCSWNSIVENLVYKNNEELMKFLFRKNKKLYVDNSKVKLFSFLDFELIYNKLKEEEKEITNII